MHDPRGGPISGPANWTSGLHARELSGHALPLRPATRYSTCKPQPELGFRASHDALRCERERNRARSSAWRECNAAPRGARAAPSVLQARDAEAYDLAYRMQADSAPEALDHRASEDAGHARDATASTSPRPSDPLWRSRPAVFGSPVLDRAAPRRARCALACRSTTAADTSNRPGTRTTALKSNLSIHCPEDRPSDQPRLLDRPRAHAACSTRRSSSGAASSGANP